MRRCRNSAWLVRDVLSAPRCLARSQCISVRAKARHLVPRHHRAQASPRSAPPDRGTTSSEPKDGGRRPAHGGVAHDFNNLLMVISGNLELIDDRAGDNDSVRRLAASARKAADRGASLIAQLLAFSRRQKLNRNRFMRGSYSRLSGGSSVARSEKDARSNSSVDDQL